MLIELATSAIVICIATFITSLIHLLIKNYNAQRRFRGTLPKLPILDGVRLLGGHTHAVAHPRSWKVLKEGQEKYGKYFGLFWNEVPCIITTDLDLIKTYVVDRADKNPNRFFKYNVAFEEMEVDNIASARDDQWRRLRKTFTPAFSRHKVMAPNVLSEIETVINRFQYSIDWKLKQAERERGEKFIIGDVDDMFSRFAYDFVFTCFYKQNNKINHCADEDPWQTASNSFYSNIINQFTYPCMVNIPMLNQTIKLLTKVYPPIARTRALFTNYIEQQTNLYREAIEQIEEAKKKDSAAKIDEDNFVMADGTVFKRNMIDHIIQRYCEGVMTDREYLHSSFLLFLAAYKPTCDVLARIFYLIASDQGVQDKLRKSILSEGTESPYLLWVINEGLRLFPPILISCARHISQDTESKIGLIPKGTLIIPNTWSIHRSTEYWGPDAEEFKPERWANLDNFHPLQFIAFGAGRRGCLGKELGLILMKLLLTKLLVSFKFERCDKTDDSLAFKSPFLLAIVNDAPMWIKISSLES